MSVKEIQKSHTWPTTKWTMIKFNKEKKTFQFSLGYLLLGFQLKTLEDFFMELFNYLYFTCQKNKSYKYWVSHFFIDYPSNFTEHWADLTEMTRLPSLTLSLHTFIHYSLSLHWIKIAYILFGHHLGGFRLWKITTADTEEVCNVIKSTLFWENNGMSTFDTFKKQ